MTWKYIKTELSTTTYQYKIYEQEQQLTMLDWLELLQGSPDFISFFIKILQESPFEAFFWECPAYEVTTLRQPFEFVVVNSQQLPKVRPSMKAFQTYFEGDKKVVTFDSLRGDALLVVPTPIVELDRYTHLANFVRTAPTKQVLIFWSTVGKAYDNSIQEGKRWLSTSGLGVPWLHVRIDSRPKYYCHQKYKD
jgi:hypothetical protein